MKYLLITLEYPPFYGGIAHYYGNLVQHFPEKLQVVDNSQGYLVQERLWWRWQPALWAVWRLLRREHFNYLLVGQILPLGTVAWLLSYLQPLRYCVFLHGYDLSCALRQPRKAKLTGKILSRAHRIICANTYTATQVKAIIDQKQLGKVKVVNPGVGTRPPYDQEAVSRLQHHYDLQQQTVLFSLGRLVERKGFDLVIDTMPQLLAAVPNLHYYLAGSGPDQQYLQDKIKALPVAVAKRVHCLGAISEVVKWQWLDACQIFVMPARTIGADLEGFGIVYLEANLAGKPVIAGHGGGVTDAVENNVNGFVIDPHSSAALVVAVSKLAHYPSLAQRLGDQGRQRARQDFNWRRQARKIYDYLH